MSIYVCRISKDHISAFKSAWNQPQNIESWEITIDASNETEACQAALGKLQPTGFRNPKSLTQVASLDESWLECRLAVSD